MTLRPRHILDLVILAAVLLAPGCKKTEPSSQLILFGASTGPVGTKAHLENQQMHEGYNKAERFGVFAAYSENTFNPSGGYVNYWDGVNGMTCSYDSRYNAWVPATYNSGTSTWEPVLTYYWPAAGYMTFQAYSPADVQPAFTWTDGFTWTDFTVPAEYHQLDLLYTPRVADCRRGDYGITDGNGYDDEQDDNFIYNGVNLPFKHALSLVEVQVSSGLGSGASLKFYIQKIELKNVFHEGDFTSSDETWNVHYTADPKPAGDYTVFYKNGDWELVPGSDEYPMSVNPDLTLILMPQDLDRDAGSTVLNTTTDAYLEVTYKEGPTGTTLVERIPLKDPWERGKKYTYRLVFSTYIEFTADITPWDAPIYGSYRVII